MKRMSIENSRSYATQAGLEKALDKYGLGDVNCVIVNNAAERFTAVFGVASLDARNVPITATIHRGFMTIN